MGRPHGLDGSFYVSGARPRLLRQGTTVWVDGTPVRIVRRAGVEQRPIVRLEGVDGREAAEALRGRTLSVERSHAPVLEENEWWAADLQGCAVVDGSRTVGVVRGLLELPSCEALEVEVQGGRMLLVPMVRDAIRRMDVGSRTIEVNMSFLEGE